LHQIKPDLFLSPDGILCLGWKGKQLGVIHDINFLHHPDVLKLSNRLYYNILFPKFAKKATRLATVSDFSKQDIIKNFSIRTTDIDTVYNGINDFYCVIPEDDKAGVREKYANGQPYFIFIGTLSPRKNIERLMSAFNHYRNHHAHSDVQLLIVGGRLYKSNEFYARRNKLEHGSSIHFLGRLPDDELNKVLGAALAMVYVPVFEGFGIPLVESMMCGVPIIASDATSIPEVVGDAAILVNPYDIEAISKAMFEVENNDELRNKLIAAGNVRKTAFSWSNTAGLLWQSVMKCLE
jgi:glycosyltransferase involved in cell wall biosynthesis